MLARQGAEARFDADDRPRERGHRAALRGQPEPQGRAADLVAAELPRSVREVGRTFRLYGKASPEIEAKLAAARYTEDQVLGDWFPEETA
jgi:hypothetical protein